MRMMFLAAIAACLSGTAWAGEAPDAAPAASAEAASEIDAIQIQRIMESVWEEVLANGVDSAVDKISPEPGAVLHADAQDPAGKAKS